MAAPSHANQGYTLFMPAYDPGGHQIGLALRVTNVVTDSSVSPALIYGDLAVSMTNSSMTSGGEYPVGATPITTTSGIVANAVAAATLAGTAGKTTYIKGFVVSGAGATVGLPVTVTVTNLAVGGVTFSFTYCATAGALLANTPLIVSFPAGVPASGSNTSIVASCPALGLGNTSNSVNVWGYQL